MSKNPKSVKPETQKPKKKPTLTSSRKARGRALQKHVRDAVLTTFSDLEPDDVRSTGMGQSGQDLQLSPAAKRKFPFAVECKNQEAISIWSSYIQAESNANDLTPLLVIKRNKSNPLAVVDFKAFMDLVSKAYV